MRETDGICYKCVAVVHCDLCRVLCDVCVDCVVCIVEVVDFDTTSVAVDHYRKTGKCAKTNKLMFLASECILMTKDIMM